MSGVPRCLLTLRPRRSDARLCNNQKRRHHVPERCKTRSVSNDVERRGAERGAQEQPGERWEQTLLFIAGFTCSGGVYMWSRAGRAPPGHLPVLQEQEAATWTPSSSPPFSQNFGGFLFLNDSGVVLFLFLIANQLHPASALMCPMDR